MKINCPESLIFPIKYIYKKNQQQQQKKNNKLVAVCITIENSHYIKPNCTFITIEFG